MAEGSAARLAREAGPTGSVHVRTTTAARGRGLGGAGGADPPVPIPNTVVKRPSADDTRRAAARDNRPVPGPPTTPAVALVNEVHCVYATRDGAVVARRAHNPKVVGSNPTPATREGPR